jgi:hypothetical protein
MRGSRHSLLLPSASLFTVLISGCATNDAHPPSIAIGIADLDPNDARDRLLLRGRIETSIWTHCDAQLSRQGLPANYNRLHQAACIMPMRARIRARLPKTYRHRVL